MPLDGVVVGELAKYFGAEVGTMEVLIQEVRLKRREKRGRKVENKDRERKGKEKARGRKMERGKYSELEIE